MNAQVDFNKILDAAAMVGINHSEKEIHDMVFGIKPMSKDVKRLVLSVETGKKISEIDLEKDNESARITKSRLALYEPIVEMLSDKMMLSDEITAALNENSNRIILTLCKMKRRGLIDSILCDQRHHYWFKAGFTNEFISEKRGAAIRREDARLSGEKTYVGVICSCGTRLRRVSQDRCIKCYAEYQRNHQIKSKEAKK
jgi:hypothetical protein